MMKIKISSLAIVISVIFTVFGASYYFYMHEQGNFHAVTPGKAYRSAQLDRDELEYYLSKYKIKSVINLRGKSPDDRWYSEETEICRNAGVTHHDFGLSADKKPSEINITTLIEIFKTAPQPVLIHCKAGADRSGLASAIWKVVMEKETKQEAEKQLSILYGHFSFGPTGVLDRFFDEWMIK